MAKMTSKIWIPKRSMAYSTRKLAKRGFYPLWCSFNLENGLVCPRLLNISTKMTSKILITKRSMDYSTRKSVKQEVYPLWVPFDLENGLFYPSGPTGSIAKVLTEVRENSF
ncbi:hypothetical protein H5410_056549 [Solanum commersonii]|uniref:Uncharacterized protein n=1 Tax=Solanum commersonii TaxID=4109 RepID=A0A9J5WMI1_SOLCO|nr:hypothetical protein H5410_056549 [Solanum commersonii]